MLPPIDMSYVADQLLELGEEIQRAFEECADPIEPAPQVLLTGLDRLLDTLRAAEMDTLEESAEALRRMTGSEPAMLLTHGLDLLAQLASLAGRLNLPRHARGVEELALPFCCWMLRRGGELLHPEPVVNAAAVLANGLTDPDELAQLFGLMKEVVEGMDPEQTLESDSRNPGRPWRVLLLNWGIVATRSRQPALMAEAFDALGEQLPEEAPAFFREGMGQMEALGYPAHVRAVMQQYFDRWCSGQRLH